MAAGSKIARDRHQFVADVDPFPLQTPLRSLGEGQEQQPVDDSGNVRVLFQTRNQDLAVILGRPFLAEGDLSFSTEVRKRSPKLVRDVCGKLGDVR